jgi:DNA polymerase III subunit gamma/tau
VVSTQAGAGKDLLRLLGDLIGHVRDLLVAGVHGEAAAPREKLLLLLDHLAETESRMRWATDKKLQFDVAVIKAVHLLEQVSLDDVLATLAAIQGGSPLPERPSAPRAVAPPAPVSNPPVAVAPQPARPVERVAVSAPAAEVRAVDLSVAWDRVAAHYETSIKFRWLTKAVFHAAPSDKALIVHLPAAYESEWRSVVGDAGRKDAEGRLAELVGHKVTLTIELSTALAEQEPPEPAAEPEPAPATEPPDEPAAADPMGDFKNDPLIKKALEMFAGELQAQNS